MFLGRSAKRMPLFFLCLIFCLPSCSTVKNAFQAVSPKSIYRKVTFQDHRKDSLKKKVLLLPFLDQARIGEERLTRITNAFISSLSKDNRIVIRQAMDPISTSQKLRSPEFGIVIDPDRAKKAEEMGMNVLLAVVINPFEFHAIKKGIWPFNTIGLFGGTRREAEVTFYINALDITNGTLILTHLESRRIDVEEDILEWEEPDEKELRKNIDEKELDKAIASILQDHAEALRKALDNHPWSGRILSVDTGKVIINAGKDVGVEEGSIFEVYGKGEPIRSGSGKTFYLLGSKVGEVRAVQIMESYASAVPLSSGPFEAGLLVRPAPN